MSQLAELTELTFFAPGVRVRKRKHSLKYCTNTKIQKLLEEKAPGAKLHSQKPFQSEGSAWQTMLMFHDVSSFLS